MKRMKTNSVQNTLEIPPDLGHLPDSVGALVPLYRECIVRFDAAVHARDLDALTAIHEEASEIIERAFSFDRFRGRRSPNNPHGFPYCFNDVADIFERLTRAAPGAVPLFGQSGRFIATLSITKVRFDVAGLCSIGMSAYNAAACSFEIRAVERDRAFFSETGYRSFMLCSLEVGERTDDVQAWCLGHLRHWWNGSGGRATKYKLPFIRSAARPVPPARPVAEDDETLECFLCGVDLSQVEEFDECADDGCVFCAECYAKHETECAECGANVKPVAAAEVKPVAAAVKPVAAALPVGTQFSLFA